MNCPICCLPTHPQRVQQADQQGRSADLLIQSIKWATQYKIEKKRKKKRKKEKEKNKKKGKITKNTDLRHTVHKLTDTHYRFQFFFFFEAQ